MPSSLRAAAATAALLAAMAFPLAAQTGSDAPEPLLPGLDEQPGSLTDRVFGGEPIEPPDWAAEDAAPSEGIVEDTVPDWAADEPASADTQTGEAPAAPAPAAGPAELEGLAVSDLVGAPVLSLDEVRVGRVTDLGLGGEGRIATLQFETGGLLGIGREAHEVPVERLRIEGRDTGAITVRLDVIEADLATLPAPSG